MELSTLCGVDILICIKSPSCKLVLYSNKSDYNGFYEKNFKYTHQNNGIEKIIGNNNVHIFYLVEFRS